MLKLSKLLPVVMLSAIGCSTDNSSSTVKHHTESTEITEDSANQEPKELKLLTCMFTEPLMEIRYNLEKNTVTKTDGMTGIPVVSEKKIILIDKSTKLGNSYQIMEMSGDVIAHLELDYNGKGTPSLPYSVKVPEMKDSANNGEGGCYSNVYYPTQTTDEDY